MSSSRYQPGKRVLIVSAAVSLAVSGLCAAQSSTPNGSTQKPAAHPSVNSTHAATGHPAAKKAGTPTVASNSIAYRRSSPHSTSTRSAAVITTAHSSTAHRVPTRTTAFASQHHTSPARRRYSAYRRPRAMTGQQRLARVHLQPERIQEIQQALAREGYLQGDPNGQWDARTRVAMLRFQTDHGFPATGLPEAKSLMKLGLGPHPLAPELDHGSAGVASPGAAQGALPAPVASPPVSQVTPPS